MAGHLSAYPLLDVLAFLEAKVKTGLLRVTGPTGEGTVRLVRGKLVSASFPGTQPLAEILVEQRLVRPQELKAALAARDDERDDRLGLWLVRNRRISQAQLGAIVWREMLRALEHMLGWAEGAFAFEDGPSEESPPVCFTLSQVQLSLGKRRDSHGRMRVAGQ
jgi:hypothetical protein